MMRVLRILFTLGLVVAITISLIAVQVATETESDMVRMQRQINRLQFELHQERRAPA